MKKKKRGCCGTFLWIILIVLAFILGAGYMNNRNNTSTRRNTAESKKDVTVSKEVIAQTEEAKTEKETVKETVKETENIQPLNLDLSSKEVIQAVQAALNHEGYDCGTPDGLIGNKTNEAVKAFKEKNGLPVDESITEDLVRVLGITEETLAAEKETEAKVQETTDEPKKEDTQEQVSGIRPEFKEAMDSYEAFFDEYVDFMNQYAENPSDLMLMAKYASYLSKYADFIQKMDAMEADAMNEEEAMYYLDVTLRIEKKLLTVAYQGGR